MEQPQNVQLTTGVKVDKCFVGNVEVKYEDNLLNVDLPPGEIICVGSESDLIDNPQERRNRLAAQEIICTFSDKLQNFEMIKNFHLEVDEL